MYVYTHMLICDYTQTDAGCHENGFKFIVAGIVFITLALFHQLNRYLQLLIHAIIWPFVLILLQAYD